MLRKKSEDVQKDELPFIKDIFDKMYNVMISSDDAVGISAPQVGINKNFLISAIVKKDDIKYFYVINPKITWVSKSQELDIEGCLSVPCVNGYVYRYKEIEIEFRDINWNLCKMHLKGLDARIMQHEIDHLNGILFIDKVVRWVHIDKKRPKIQKYNILFFGSPAYSISSLKYLMQNHNIVGVITQHEKPIGRDQQISRSAIHDFCIKNNLKVFTPNDLNNSNFINELIQLKPDLGVVVSYGKIIPQIIIDIPKFGMINLHASILPKYRGASPIQQTLLNDDKISGVTMQKLDKKMDSGNIIHIEKISIDKNDNYIDVSEKMEKANIECLEKINSYLNGDIIMSIQDEKKVSYCNKIKKEDGLIDPQNMRSSEIYNKYRAFFVWPKIYMMYKGKRIILHDIEISDKKIDPGSFLLEKKKLFLGTKDFAIIINKLQMEGKKITDGYTATSLVV